MMKRKDADFERRALVQKKKRKRPKRRKGVEKVTVVLLRCSARPGNKF